MNTIIGNSSLTVRDLERVEARLASEGFLPIEAERRCFLEKLDREFQDDLGMWFERQRGRYFTLEETTLQCVVALRYADVTRPTVRELWQYLQALILNDARMLGEQCKLRFPSYSTFRSRIADLPRGFVWKARMGVADGRPSISAMVTRFESIASSPA